MFNWFRRQFGKDNTAPESAPPEGAEVSPELAPEVIQAETESPSEEDSQTTELAAPPPEEPSSDTANPDDYLQWAKAAYQNIQARKAETVSPPESAAAITVEAGIEETAEEIVVAPESDQATATEADLPSPETEITTGPAWLQKSDRLEALKETAVEEATVAGTLTAESMAMDDDFMWSAKVLAAQGRSAADVSAEEIDWLRKLRQGLSKTRVNLVNQLKSIVGQGPLNEAAVEEIEAILLQADVGVEATDYIITTLQDKLREEALPPEQAIEFLKEILRSILDRPLLSLPSAEFAPEAEGLNVWLLTGVNGAGKTTTIGKLAFMAKQSGYDCVIAAADTFRAAAVEQVKVWGERSGVPVIANPGQNTDPAAVVYDGISAAQSRNVNLLLVDTAGRLQNKKNLMDELAKIRRIIDKKAPNATVESLLVLDATLGQNGLRQAEVFAEAAKLSGVVLTKLDGSAKGGVALAVAQQLNLPIRFIGAGEGIEDLRPFSSYEFVEALLNG
ncbi:cell division protein; FtsY [Synechocystis sp. PCC 6803]|uniref:Signal recognition particle receptor FtsY n=1 Tax=Synechocystis sp. (strain ATCC 27184 / PCC 6803 / Kazusa) TaxID=1111708 RepID=FTSY_SYNY3|nr:MULTISPECIES: signal recognition particle-docking protein FtsY [unclassified Synechocystis]P73930.1 RecName: Full=Signal recognition particle receptor FtsY; Short=SRP receptor [Synechocystis sp. PCC 6803 substr. Kazusa]BAM51752.1 cell division protein FtsY [Synechocystis sp. PCC 6803] [Bacillus subtilis BEST7613]AGF51684.1 cell division protein FtsY [Synechocystis sp. PCC 6803]ALJ67677.1 cell division protein [Synechocystis sp. PCC 6803]AVP89511.1 signal recognition particle-docking protein